MMCVWLMSCIDVWELLYIVAKFFPLLSTIIFLYFIFIQYEYLNNWSWTQQTCTFSHIISSICNTFQLPFTNIFIPMCMAFNKSLKTEELNNLFTLKYYTISLIKLFRLMLNTYNSLHTQLTYRIITMSNCNILTNDSSHS